MNRQITLTNGRTVRVRSKIIRGGLILGYMTWTGKFINIANVAKEDR